MDNNSPTTESQVQNTTTDGMGTSPAASVDVTQPSPSPTPQLVTQTTTPTSESDRPQTVEEMVTQVDSQLGLSQTSTTPTENISTSEPVSNLPGEATQAIPTDNPASVESTPSSTPAQGQAPTSIPTPTGTTKPIDPEPQTVTTATQDGVDSEARAVQSDIDEQGVDLYNVNMGDSINLIPGLSRAERQAIKKRQTTSFSGLSFLVGLVVISLIVFSVSIYSRISLNSVGRQNDELETEILSESTIVNNNNRILDRLSLLGATQSNTYSPKDVFNFWKDTFESYGEITSFKINNDLEFELEGTASSIEDATKLWHLLNIDERILDVVLTNIANSETDESDSFVFISFEGQLNYEYFVTSQINQ